MDSKNKLDCISEELIENNKLMDSRIKKQEYDSNEEIESNSNEVIGSITLIDSRNKLDCISNEVIENMNLIDSENKLNFIPDAQMENANFTNCGNKLEDNILQDFDNILDDVDNSDEKKSTSDSNHSKIQLKISFVNSAIESINDNISTKIQNDEFCKVLFKCVICAKAFRTKNQRACHMRTHKKKSHLRNL